MVAVALELSGLTPTWSPQRRDKIEPPAPPSFLLPPLCEPAVKCQQGEAMSRGDAPTRRPPRSLILASDSALSKPHCCAKTLGGSSSLIFALLGIFRQHVHTRACVRVCVFRCASGLWEDAHVRIGAGKAAADGPPGTERGALNDAQ